MRLRPRHPIQCFHLDREAYWSGLIADLDARITILEQGSMPGVMTRTQAEFDAALTGKAGTPFDFPDFMGWARGANLTRSTDIGTPFAWHGQHLMQAMVMMYRATGATKYLDNCVSMCDYFFLNTDDVREARGDLDFTQNPSAGDRYTENRPLNFVNNPGTPGKGWGYRNASNTQRQYKILESAEIMAGIAHFIDLVEDNPALSAYQTDVTGYISKCQDIIAEQDETWDSKSGLQLIPFNVLSSGSLSSNPVRLNQVLALGYVLAVLEDHGYNPTGGDGTTYRAKVEGLLDHFCGDVGSGAGQALTDVDDADGASYTWDSYPYESTGGVEDLTHGAIDVRFFVRTKKSSTANGGAGAYSPTSPGRYSRARLANTRLKKIWSAGSVINSLVDGSGPTETVNDNRMYAAMDYLDLCDESGYECIMRQAVALVDSADNDLGFAGDFHAFAKAYYWSRQSAIISASQSGCTI